MKRIDSRSPRQAGPGHSKQARRAKPSSFRAVLGRPRVEVEPQVVSGGKPRPGRSLRETERGVERELTPRDARISDEPRGDVVRVDEFLYNPVLHSAVTTNLAAPSVPQASALERAQAAALAERVFHSVQVGRIQGGHLVRLRLSSDVEVELRHCDGVLQATVVGDGDQGVLARRLDAEFRARGLRFDRVELG